MGKDLKGNPLPPGIMQRKSGIYRGRFYYKGETYTKDNADLKKLVQEMEDLRYEVKHGLKGKGDNITLDTWFDIWLNTHKKRTIKESTQVRYDDFYRRYIKKQIGKQRVADFNPIILERLLQNMADDDYSTKTIRDVLFSMLCSNMQCITGFLHSTHVQEWKFPKQRQNRYGY